MKRIVYHVVIAQGRIGFPVGLWTRLLYRAMAQNVIDGDLARLGCVAKIVEVEE